MEQNVKQMDFDLAVGSMVGKSRETLGDKKTEALDDFLQTIGRTPDEFWAEVDRFGSMKL